MKDLAFQIYLLKKKLDWKLTSEPLIYFAFNLFE